MPRSIYEKFVNKKISLYVEGHRYPFVGELIENNSDHLVINSEESDRLIIFKYRIVGFFKFEEKKKYL